MQYHFRSHANKPLGRRDVLKGLIALSAAPAVTSEVAFSHEDRPATDEDLTRYYAFLWLEFASLSREMGVEMHSSSTAHRNGDIVALEDRLKAPPSTRANLVMSALQADCGSLQSSTLRKSKKPGVSAEARANYHYAEFVKAMNEATSGSAGWLLSTGGRRAGQGNPVDNWTQVKSIHLDEVTVPGTPAYAVERHRSIDWLTA